MQVLFFYDIIISHMLLFSIRRCNYNLKTYYRIVYLDTTYKVGRKEGKREQKMMRLEPRDGVKEV